MAAEVSTDPLGVFTFEASGNSDSYVYLPLRRVPEFVGAVSALSKNANYDLGEPFTDSNGNKVRDAGEVFEDTDNVITLSGNPSLTANQYVYAAGSQSKHYYLLVTSGPRAGMYYTVLANGVASFTVDAAGDNLPGSLSAGSSVEIVPFHTLNSIFPGGVGVHPCSTHSIANRQSEILIPDNATAGKDLAAVVSYYYFSGTTGAGPGWRRAGAASVLANDDVLLPDTFFVIRHNISSATTVKMLGGVQMATLSTPLNISAGVDQDNSVALPFATEVTLAQLNLVASGAFAGSSTHSISTRQDQLLVWDNSIPGRNKAADSSYYYYTGTSGAGPGWRKSGVASVVADSDVVISNTKCIVIRKKAGSAASTVLWSVRPSYAPAP